MFWAFVGDFPSTSSIYYNYKASVLASMSDVFGMYSDSDSSSFLGSIFSYFGCSPAISYLNLASPNRKLAKCSRFVHALSKGGLMTGEEAITDQRSVTVHNEDHSILFLCPNLVSELRSWIRKRLKQGGRWVFNYSAHSKSC